MEPIHLNRARWLTHASKLMMTTEYDVETTRSRHQQELKLDADAAGRELRLARGTLIESEAINVTCEAL